jgi:hypothetical protein
MILKNRATELTESCSGKKKRRMRRENEELELPSQG